jgi:hypothetical protein
MRNGPMAKWFAIGAVCWVLALFCWQTYIYRKDAALLLSYARLAIFGVGPYWLPRASASLSFAPEEVGSKRIQVAAGPPSTEGRTLSLKISKTGLNWTLKGPDGTALAASACKDDREAMHGIPLQECNWELGPLNAGGEYQLDAQSGASPAPALAILTYGEVSKRNGVTPYPKSDWPKAWVDIPGPNEDPEWPEAGRKSISKFALMGQRPSGDLTVATTVEYLPAMPSNGFPQPKIERFESKVSGDRGQVEFTPPFGGAMRITHRVAGADQKERTALGTSRWLPVSKRAALVQRVRRLEGMGLELDLDVELGGTYQLGAEARSSVFDPWLELSRKEFALQPEKQTVRVPLDDRKLFNMTGEDGLALRVTAKVSGMPYPLYVGFANEANRPLSLDRIIRKVKTDPSLSTAKIRPLRRDGKFLADLVEVFWKMETNGGYCRVQGRLISPRTGRRVEMAARGAVPLQFAQMTVRLVFPAAPIRALGDALWDFEGLQVCGESDYPAVPTDWKAEYRTRLQLNPKDLAEASSGHPFEVRENFAFFRYNYLKQQRLPGRFAVPVYAQGPFDPGTRLRVGEVEKGFRVSTSRLRPFQSTDIPVAEVWIEAVRMLEGDPFETRYIPIHIEGKGVSQELIVVCPMHPLSVWGRGTSVPDR